MGFCPHNLKVVGSNPTPATKCVAASNRPENQTKSKNPAGALYGGSGQGGQDRFVGGGHCSAVVISSIQSASPCFQSGSAMPNRMLILSPARREFFGRTAGNGYSSLGIGSVSYTHLTLPTNR